MAFWIPRILLNAPLLISAQLGNLFFCTNLGKININGCEILKLIPTHSCCSLTHHLTVPKRKNGLWLHEIFYNTGYNGNNYFSLGEK